MKHIFASLLLLALAACASAGNVLSSAESRAVTMERAYQASLQAADALAVSGLLDGKAAARASQALAVERVALTVYRAGYAARGGEVTEELAALRAANLELEARVLRRLDEAE